MISTLEQYKAKLEKLTSQHLIKFTGIWLQVFRQSGHQFHRDRVIGSQALMPPNLQGSGHRPFSSYATHKDLATSLQTLTPLS